MEKDGINRKELERLFDELFPICRSIMGEGYRESLRLLKRYVPFDDITFKTGESVLNWTVPKEWKINEAWIKDETGNVILDFTENSLNIVNYSMPIDLWLDLNELKKHIYTSGKNESAIPYTFSYYKERWGFCMSQKQLNALPEGRYHVYIDSSMIDGKLVVGETVLKGRTDREILLTSYLCHPSMANNELSGPLVLAMLYNKISNWKERKYTYRFVINPETIGSISYLSKRGEYLKEKMFAGLVLTCLGGTQNLRYKTSRQENSPLDLYIEEINSKSPGTYRVEQFVPYNGSDERQYCSPGFDLPMGQMARLVYGEYPEYHTSLDSKGLMGIDNIIDSADRIERMLLNHEQEVYFINTKPNGEVKLGDYDLYPSINSEGLRGYNEEELKNQPWFISCVMTLLNYGDGKHPLSYVARRLNMNYEDVKQVLRILEEKKLVVRQ